MLEVGYAGHQGRKLVWGVGINDNQLPSNLLALGPALNTLVRNPFFHEWSHAAKPRAC